MPAMVTQILLHTPAWVWALFAALLALGFWQSRPRVLAPRQVLVLPAVMLGLGLWSSAGAFAALPWLALAWLKGLALGFAVGRRLAPAARWDGQRLHLAGSAWPLVLVVAIFSLRYASSVALALHPALLHRAAVMLPLTAVYGVLGGLFAGRAFALWQRTQGTTIGAHAAAA